jgi:prepilin-type N-terminal cleavage/methylation domain-containing protein
MSNRNRQLSRIARDTESGFTIVELLIATLIFSVVLLIITFGILQVTNTFFKGENDASTQRVATNVLNTIAQAIQFDGGTVTSGVNTICVGSQQFSFWPGYELEPSIASGKYQSTTALIENSGGCTGRSTTGRELLTDNMRLSNLTVKCLSTAAVCSSPTADGAVYQIEVRVVFGDDNLLFSPSKTAPAATAPDAECEGALEGEQFCAVSDISTIVAERI